MNPIDEHIDNILEYSRELDTCEICGVYLTDKEKEHDNGLCFFCYKKHKEAEETLTRG